ncbi:MAG: ABC transporter substrate-binding protein, partial [Burkholderiales bacterium]
MSDRISIQFTRFSAFYSPLIATIAGGFLEKEGLQPEHSVSPPGKSAIEGLVDGTVHVAQSAPSQAITALEQGKTPPALHFAQVNEKDGFFLVGREAEPKFTWDRLKGREVLVDHGGQPMVMFRYACFKRGLDFGAIRAVDAGSSNAMVEAFRAGKGDYIHLQGPAPQQLEHDGVGHIVAALGDAIGPCAF